MRTPNPSHPLMSHIAVTLADDAHFSLEATMAIQLSGAVKRSDFARTRTRSDLPGTFISGPV